jgi:myotubularin-related protein 6/7/8
MCIADVDQLYAFYYQPSPKWNKSDGWERYQPELEYRRMGVGTLTKEWRFTDINKTYEVSH